MSTTTSRALCFQQSLMFNRGLCAWPWSGLAVDCCAHSAGLMALSSHA